MGGHKGSTVEWETAFSEQKKKKNSDRDERKINKERQTDERRAIVTQYKPLVVALNGIWGVVS